MRLFLLSFALVIAFSVNAQEQSCKVTTPPVIDGKIKDWSVTWMDEEKEKFEYNVCSDDANLYIRIKISDGGTQQKFAMYGLTVWLDPNGKKKEKLGLRYPTGIEAQERLEEFRKSGESFSKENNLDKREAMQKEFKRNLIRNIEVLELIGLADKPLASSKSGITNGLQVALDMDSTGAYIYEATLPFKAFRLVKAKIPVLGIGFETGKLTVDQTKGKGNNAGGGMQPGGYPGGGMGGMGQGGMGQAGRGGSNYYSPMSSPVKMWTAVKLD
ncbi:MAG TPA: hypothetical protein VIT44_00435 [Cyclobacteriaceae bacterium]